MAQKEPIRNFVLHDRHGHEIDFSSLSVVSGVSVTFHAGVGEPYCESRYQGGILYLDFYNIKGEGINSITYDESQEDGGTNYIHISIDGGNEYTFPVKNGSRGNGIISIDTAESQEDDGYNTITIYTTDKPEGVAFRVKNGRKGDKGDQGEKGEQGDSAIWDENAPHEKLTDLSNILGDSTVKPMSQKGVTKAIVNYAYRGTKQIASSAAASLRIVTDTTPATTATASADTNKIFYAHIIEDSYVKVSLTKTKATNKKVVIAIFDTVPNVANVEVREILFDGEVAYEEGETTKVFEYDYYVESGLYIGLYEISTYSTCVFEEGITAFDEVDAAKRDISSVAEEVRGETKELEQGTDYTVTTGKYINKNGSPASINNSKYTSPISVLAGDKIVYVCNGSTSGNIASLAKVIVVDSQYEPLVVDTDGTKERTFIVTEDMNVAFSCLKDNFEITIKRGGVYNTIEKAEKQIEEINAKTDEIAHYNPNDGMPMLGENPLARLISGPSRARIFASYGVIGASFECGVGNPGNGTQIYDNGYEWPTLLGKVNGVEVYNYALAGRPLNQWLQRIDGDDEPQFPGHCVPWSERATPAECYIINMSSNDLTWDKYKGIAGDVGDIDLTHDYSEDPYDIYTPFTEVVTAIIQLCRKRSPKCFIMLATVRKNSLTAPDYRTAQETEDLCDAMKDVAELFENCFVIDMHEYGLDWPSVGRSLGYQSVGVHPTRLGHIYLADAFNTYIDWIVDKNRAAFKDVSLILT